MWEADGIGLVPLENMRTKMRETVVHLVEDFRLDYLRARLDYLRAQVTVRAQLAAECE